ncbi:MAG: 16S rRNA pseudouridine(516) synthase [Gammaproteobacteria bacterium]|nr:MAG: 16S rRNA pseudouridine(516) synthase [Gammaproteobacteria bacterium]
MSQNLKKSGLRLDKFIAKATGSTRSKAKKLILSGQVSVDQKICKSVGLIVSSQNQIELSGDVLAFTGNRYILINKPKGCICSSKDEQYPSVFNLLGLNNLDKLHFAGRLDVDTSGLVLISDDGQWTHRITSPTHKQAKTYIVTTSEPLTRKAIQQLEKGVLLKDSAKPTLPAIVSTIDDYTYSIAITEGRYHQVKRMFAAVGNHVVELHRRSIGSLILDETMEDGQWRHLTEKEIESF